jgi:hypothetical protein
LKPPTSLKPISAWEAMEGKTSRGSPISLAPFSHRMSTPISDGTATGTADGKNTTYYIILIDNKV